MEKRLVLPRGGAMLKSHVKGYTRKDGTFVQEHDDKRQKKDDAYSHPHVVGKSKVIDPHATGHKDASGIQFAGTEYWSTGKSGKSFHDETPVREFEAEDGHRVWGDDHGRVHADSKDEVPHLRKKFEAHNAENGPPEKGDRFNAGESDPVHGGDGKEKQPEAKSGKVDKAAVLEVTLGKANTVPPSLPPSFTAEQIQKRVDDYANSVKDLGFELADPKDAKPVDKNGNSSTTLTNAAGQRVVIMTQDGGDRTKVSITLLDAAPGADKAAGGAAGGSGAPKADKPAGGADRRSHAQKMQDAEDASYSGESEKEDYGVYHKPGSKVRDNRGNEHEVVRHRGPTVTTKGGKEFHPTKLTPVDKGGGNGSGGKPAAKPKAKPKGDDFASLKSHPMHSQSDLDYFKGKGYSAKEIKEIWDRDHAAGHKPVQHKAQPDVVGDHAKFLEKKDKDSGGKLFKSLVEGTKRLLLK